MSSRIASVLAEAWLLAALWTCAWVLGAYVFSLDVRSHVSLSAIALLAVALAFKTGVVMSPILFVATTLVLVSWRRAGYGQAWFSSFWLRDRDQRRSWVTHAVIAACMCPVGVYADQVGDWLMIRVLF